MHEFDIYINTEIKQYIDNINIQENRNNQVSKNYSKVMVIVKIVAAVLLTPMKL